MKRRPTYFKLHVIGDEGSLDLNNLDENVRVYVGHSNSPQSAGDLVEGIALDDSRVAWDEPPFDVRQALTDNVDKLSSDPRPVTAILIVGTELR